MNSQIIQTITGLGVLFAACGYGYSQFFRGKNDKIRDDLRLFTDQLDALRKVADGQALQIHTLQDDLKKHTQEIGRLQGVNEEKEKKIKELTDLLSNRDPALMEFMKFARDYFSKLYEYLELIDGKINKHITKGVVE